MNTSFTTTGLVPLTIGSTETFQLQAYNNGLPWDLTGGSATLLLTDPNGTQYSYPATVLFGGAKVNWTVLAPSSTPTNPWLRAWSVTDANSVHQVSRPIAFAVVSSPS